MVDTKELRRDLPRQSEETAPLNKQRIKKEMFRRFAGCSTVAVCTAVGVVCSSTTLSFGTLQQAAYHSPRAVPHQLIHNIHHTFSSSSLPFGNVALRTPVRALSVRTEDFFSKEAISHARRVSWAPHTTEKKQGAFAKLARSNFTDPEPESFHNEPFFEEEIEAYRAHHRPDVYVYKYNVSPTHMSLRE